MASRISGKRLQRVTVVCALLLGAATPLAAEPVAAAEGTSRVVAIGDIHGDFDAFVSVLQEAGLVDTEHRWIGGAATLVQTGDFTDRGPEVRAVMDLLMTLEAQAESAGGRVEVLLGNHEVMNLMRDVRDVNPQVYASFIDGESEARRKTAFRAYGRLRMLRLSANITASDLQQREDEWLAAHPPGFLEYQEALGPQGHYGRWLRAKPVAIQLGDTIFLHAGIPPELAELSLEDINERVWRELEAFDAYQRELVERQLTLPFFTFEEFLTAAHTARYPMGSQAPAVLERVLNIGGWFTVHPSGPLWFRGYATWPEDEGTAHSFACWTATRRRDSSWGTRSQLPNASPRGSKAKCFSSTPACWQAATGGAHPRWRYKANSSPLSTPKRAWPHWSRASRPPLSETRAGTGTRAGSRATSLLRRRGGAGRDR